MMKKRAIPLSLIKILNTASVALPFLICWLLYYEQITLTTESKQVSVLVIFMYCVIFYSLCLQLDGFRRPDRRIRGT